MYCFILNSIKHPLLFFIICWNLSWVSYSLWILIELMNVQSNMAGGRSEALMSATSLILTTQPLSLWYLKNEHIYGSDKENRWRENWYSHRSCLYCVNVITGGQYLGLLKLTFLCLAEQYFIETKQCLTNLRKPLFCKLLTFQEYFQENSCIVCRIWRFHAFCIFESIRDVGHSKLLQITAWYCSVYSFFLDFSYTLS